MSARVVVVAIGVLVIVAVGAGFGGYELGLHSPRPGSPIASAASPTPSAGAPSPSASPTALRRNAPTPRGNASWVFDAATGKFVLYGGNVTSTGSPVPLGDTWGWDGKTWTPLTTPASSGPSGRFDAQAVYDESRGVVLLHGGATGTAFDGDTWTWDGTRWLQLGPNQSPLAESVAGVQPMAFDPANGLVILVRSQFMASGGTPIETWTWNGNNWSRVATSAQPIAGRGDGTLAYDPGRKNVVFFNHTDSGQPETWVFDGTSWTQMPTTSGTTSQSFVMARDDLSSSIVLFGSNGDTWTWDGNKWSPANPAHSPGPRTGMAITYDSTHHVVALFGGGNGADAGFHNDVWTWDGTDWTQVTGS